MPTPISSEAREVLAASTLNALAFKLPARQLERPIYEEVNKILTSLGGKWSAGKKAHLFKDDPSISLALIEETGTFIDVRKDAQFFPTPSEVVTLMLEVSSLYDGARVLEPSAGTGAIAKALYDDPRALQIDCCEWLALHRKALTEYGLNVVANDFLAYQTTEEYDAVLMNPPFALEGDSTAYITHIQHAWSMLRDGGSFVAIVPPGWLTNTTKKQTEFREWVCDILSFEEIGAGAFKSSGTGVNTFLIYGTKEAQGWRTKPINGWQSFHSWTGSLWLDNDYPTYLKLRECKDINDFGKLCQDAANDLRRREHIPIVLRPADIDELWRHYQDEE